MKLLVAIALAGCGSKAAPDTCKADAEELAKFLDATPHQPVMFVTSRDVVLAVRDDLGNKRVPMAPTVSINVDQIVYQGAIVDRLGLQEKLQETRAKLAGDQPRIHLLVDRNTYWTQVVDLVQVTDHAGFTAPGFVFDTGTEIKAPPGAVIEDRDPERITLEPRAPDDFFAACPPVAALLGELGRYEGNENKADRLVRLLAPALVECGCKIDLAEVRRRLFTLIVESPVLRVLAFDGPRVDRIVLPATMTWREAQQRLAPGKSYQLVVE